jgi:hypothetical protein
LVVLRTTNRQVDYNKVLIYYQAPNSEKVKQIKDDLLKLKLTNEIVIGLDGKMKVPKDNLNELPDDILVKKVAEDIILNQGNINEIVKLRSV